MLLKGPFLLFFLNIANETDVLTMFRDANGSRIELRISIDVWIISHINQQKCNKIVDARVESDTSSSYDAPAIMVTFFCIFSHLKLSKYSSFHQD